MIFLPMQTKAQENEVYEYLTLKEDGTIEISPQNSSNLIEYIKQLQERAKYKDKYERLKETTDELLAVKDKKIEVLNDRIDNLKETIRLKNKKLINKDKIIAEMKKNKTEMKIKYGGSGAAVASTLILLMNLR